MAVLHFVLNEDAVTILHDALACMFKFSDHVCLEGRKDKLTLTTLNISKSAYICFAFSGNRFFSRYHFDANTQHRDRFSCQLYTRSLLSVFRARQSGEAAATRESTVDRCEVAIEDGPGQKSRLIARVICRNGLTASHSLAFEPKAPVHAKFDNTEATNYWAISSRTLRQLMDHFGPGIELLDINTDDDTRVVNFTCFTEKVAKRGANNNEAVLKKPLHTNIAVEMDEFDNVDVQDKLHIIISVKDFRAILQHAQLISGELSTSYSNPGRPMKLSYGSEGILCEFILMTVGEKDVISHKHKNPRATSAAPKGQRPAALDAASHRGSSAAIAKQKQPSQLQAQPVGLMPLQRPTGQSKAPIRSRQPQFEIRPAPVPPAASARSDSLFVPQDDDDKQWEPLNPDEEEPEVVDNDRLLWNSNNTPASGPRISSYANLTAADSEPPPADHVVDGLDPTQRLSDVRRFGLFSS